MRDIKIFVKSDQRIQFTGEEYKQFLKEDEVRQSMDSKSRWADNIMIERCHSAIGYIPPAMTYYSAMLRDAVKESAASFYPFPILAHLPSTTLHVFL